MALWGMWEALWGSQSNSPPLQQFFNSCHSFNIFKHSCKIFKTIKGEKENQQWWESWDESLLANCFSPALSHSGFPWTIQCRQSELRSRLIKRLWKSPIISLMALSTQASSYLEWYPNWKGHRFSHEERVANWRSAVHSGLALLWLILKRIKLFPDWGKFIGPNWLLIQVWLFTHNVVL